jgi:alpha-glucosidase
VLDTGAVQVAYTGGGAFSSANLTIRFMLNGRTVEWTPGTPDTGNLRGARRTLDECRGEASLEPGLLSRDGWTLHDDSAAVRFDPATGWVQPAAPGPRQDWYFFAYGHDFAAAIAEYAQISGAVPLIPRWALGAWWSRYWAYSEQDLRTLVADFAAHDLPLDVLVIDMDWHTPDGWTGYTWNRELFPDPPAFLAWLHDQGLRTTLNLHPPDGVQPHEEAYPAFAAALGQDPAARAPVPFRSADPRFVEHYFALLHHPLEEQGVDFWWMDWQQGRTSEVPGLDPLPWLNHLHYRDMQRRAGRRALVFSRWGGLGNHRYPIGFSGDTYPTWEALRFQPYFTATAANVAYGWWSHDIGGHFTATDPEIYARWVQFGAYSPILRLHSSNGADAERRPWAFPPETFAAARSAFHQRYALLPYLYTLARMHADTALAPCRPLYFLAPEQEAAYVAREQYLLGDQLIVAPIVHPRDAASGLAPADVWIPPGTWIERSSGEQFVGPQWVRLAGDLQAIPQLVRAGGILPLAPVAERSHRQPRDQLILSVFPGADGALRLYDDAGEGEAYRTGACEWTPIALAWAADGRACTLTIEPVEGCCADLPRERAITVQLEHCNAPESILLDGASHPDWRFDSAAHRIVISLQRRPKTEPITIRITAANELARGSAPNAALRLADAQRLLGSTTTDGDADALIATALERTDAAAAHALARLGGPFVRAYTYTTPEDARKQFGALVLAAPRDGAPASVSGVWQLAGAAGVREAPFSLGELTEDTIIACPFAWDGRVQTIAWSLDVAITWRGRTLHRRIDNPPLFPSIGAWRTLVVPAHEQLALTKVVDPNGEPSADLAWQSHRHAPGHGEFQNLSAVFSVPLREYAFATPGVDLVAYAIAVLHSPEARAVCIDYQADRPVQIYVNGAAAAIAQHVETPPFGLNMEWSRSAPVQLHPGKNTLLIVSDHPGDTPAWHWFLQAKLTTPEGAAMPEVRAM